MNESSSFSSLFSPSASLQPPPCLRSSSSAREPGTSNHSGDAARARAFRRSTSVAHPPRWTNATAMEGEEEDGGAVGVFPSFPPPPFFFSANPTATAAREEEGEERGRDPALFPWSLLCIAVASMRAPYAKKSTLLSSALASLSAVAASLAEVVEVEAE